MDFNENAWIRSNYNYFIIIIIFHKKLYSNIFNIKLYDDNLKIEFFREIREIKFTKLHIKRNVSQKHKENKKKNFLILSDSQYQSKKKYTKIIKIRSKK